MAKVTIDDLAVMIKRQFDRQDKRFDGIDVRLDSMDKRFDGIDVRLDSMDKRFDRIDDRLDTMQISLDQIRGELKEINQRLDRLEKRTLEDDNVLALEIDTLKERVAILENKLNKLKVAH